MATTLRADHLRQYSLSEYESVDIEIGPKVAADMHADGHVSVAPSLAPGFHTIKAKHKVGVLRYGGVELRIVPKVAVSRLLYLASYSHDSSAWEELDTLLGAADDPLSALAHALAYHGEAALRPTPIQGYVTHEEAERRLRGRVLFDRQLSRRAGIQLPIELRYDEYEVNVVENRVLKTAFGLVERHTPDPALSRRLAHLRFRLDGVEPWPTGMSVPAFHFTRLNDRYRASLALARLIVEQGSLEFPDRTQRGSAFLFNMNHVFEKYVEAELRRALESRGGRVVGQRQTFLDEADTVAMKPDVTWWSGDHCLAVIDAKYKRATSDDFPNADAYQMLAYCTRLGLRRGVLVYADLGDTIHDSTTIRNAGVEIVTTALDISGSIDDLRANVTALAKVVTAPAS
ncbi:McrC family protein [Ilumatobacter nonamiensis]|uniref:McrC family protein n=1 Tax=Ilumatobacter nonamiensis TaxID=467093 RepID=UPI00130E609E|nr:restriction endonuclease [Ilumatobacter nonamiensis]